jgi:Tfp pilus assembly protein PilN
MIQINLLPIRQAKQRKFGKQQIVFAAVFLLLEVTVLYYVYAAKQAELEEFEATATGVDAEVAKLQKDNLVIKELSDQRKNLQELSKVLEELEANRAGPVQVLDDLKVMLNPPANDLEKVSQDRRGWTTSWDPSQVWLSSFKEDDGELSITGNATTNEDIAEFNARLASSVYFKKVRLNFTALEKGTQGGQSYAFSISAQVNYGLAEEVKPAAPPPAPKAKTTEKEPG